MINKKSDTEPRSTLEVSDKERDAAKRAKKTFKNLLRNLDDTAKPVFDLKDAVVKERPSQQDLINKYRGRLIRYRRRIQSEFNEHLRDVKQSIESLGSITDSEMLKLKEIIVSEYDDLSDIVENFLSLLGEPGREGFTEKLERATTQLEARQEAIHELIDGQFIKHIDSDILGRQKISSIRANIYKRIRLLRKLT